MAGTHLERQPVYHREMRLPPRTVLSYDIAFDVLAYKQAHDLRARDPLLFEEKKRVIDAYIERQLVTNLGERFNVLLSKTKYEVKDGKIVTLEGERLLDVMIRGRNYRRKHGNPSDFEREDAEIAGMEKIENVLGDAMTSRGTIMLSISAPGKGDSVYKHNFYDVFTLGQEDGKRFIEARRYSSGLKIAEYVDRINTITGRNIFIPDSLPAYMLKNPVRIEGFDADRLHRFFHIDHRVLPEYEFSYMVNATKLLRNEYKRFLEQNFNDRRGVALRFNAILNGADDALEILRHPRSRRDSFYIYKREEIPDVVSLNRLFELGTREVRTVSSGCGTSAGSSFEGESHLGVVQVVNPVSDVVRSPFSVGDFSSLVDDLGDRKFSCPECEFVNTRPYNQKIRLCENPNYCPDRKKVAC